MALTGLTQQLLITEALIALLLGPQQDEGCFLKAAAELGSRGASLWVVPATVVLFLC